MEKIIFLDIDGVLNSQYSFKEKKEERLLLNKIVSDDIDIVVKKVMCDIDYEKIKLLKYITDVTCAKIVVCSSLRRTKYYIFVEEKLIEMGLPIVGQTEYIRNKRGEEIRKCLTDNNVDKFIILDDEVFDDYNELINYLVKTDFYNDGLTEDTASEAIKLLIKK